MEPYNNGEERHIQQWLRADYQFYLFVQIYFSNGGSNCLSWNKWRFLYLVFLTDGKKPTEENHTKYTRNMPRQPKTDMIYSRKSGAKAGANKKSCYNRNQFGHS